MSLGRLRIFISSPGDVAEERVIANNLVRRLSDEYAERLWIEPVFWEHEPLLATETFQKQIPPPRDCEVVVCVLWSRLGTRLPASITRADGSRYASGTEYEFEDAAEAFRRNGSPELLVYRKKADPVVSLGDTKVLMERIAQKEALDGFIRKWFIDETDGTLKAAYHSFAATADFEQLLEGHLRKLIARRLPAGIMPAAATKLSWTAGSPFRGLDVFEFEHAPVFFGRTQAVGDVLNALRTNAAAGRAFVLVVGVSGGGKSSLVRAGVLPVLTQAGVIEGVGLWRRAVLKPSDSGGNLLRALASALLAPNALAELASDGTTADQLAELLRQSPAAAFPLIKGGLSQTAATFAREHTLAHQPQARLVIVVDQLEELFTLSNVTPADRTAFIAAISALARSGRVWVIATLRGDFYHRSFELPELVALQEGAGQYALPLPTPAEIGQLIRQPARAAGLTFEEDPATKVSLDEVLRDAAGARPESLPLLEFALNELYQRKTTGGLLTYAAYRDLGGVEGALTKQAEAVFASLAPDVQATLPRVMRGLVNVSDGGSIARQLAPLDNVAPTRQAKAFVEAFVQARLFAADRTEQGQAVVRVTHEALLRTWPRILRWLEQDRELLIVRSRVSAVAGRWQAEGRRSDLLLGEGMPLAEAEALAATLGSELAPEERALIAASKAGRKRRALLKRVAVVALVVLTVAAGAAAAYARRQKSQADASAQIAAANARRAEENARRAAAGESAALQNANAAELRLAEGLVSQGDALALASHWRDAKVNYWEAYKKLLELHASPFRAEAGLSIAHASSPPPLLSFTGHAAGVTGVAILPDGRTALSGSNDGTLKLWDLMTGKEIRTLAGNTAALPGVTCIAISPDGRTALSGHRSDMLALWDLTTGKEIRTFAGHAPGYIAVTCVAIGPDGHTALAGSGDGNGTLTLWDLNTGKEIRTIKTPRSITVRCVAFSPDGQTALAGGDDNTLTLWDLTTGEQKKPPLTGHTYHLTSVAISPDGRSAISGSEDTKLILWDLTTGSALRTFAGHRNYVTSVAISPDGRTALSASKDKTLKRWDLSTGTEIQTLTGHTEDVSSVAFGPDGDIAVSGSADKSLKLWCLTPAKETRTLPGHASAVSTVAVSPDGRTALSGSWDSTLKLWDLATGKLLRTFQGHTDKVTSVAISPDGRAAFSGSTDRDAKTKLLLWDLTTGDMVAKFPSHHTFVFGVAISPDGRTALSGGFDESLAPSDSHMTLEHWDLTTGSAIRTFTGIHPIISSIAFRPDGRTALSGCTDQTLSLWDLTTGKVIRDIGPKADKPTNDAISVAVSPDGNTAFSGGSDGILTLWDLTSGREIRAFPTQPRHVTSVAMSADGHTGLSGCADDTVKLWDLNTGKEIRTLTRHGDHRDQVKCVAFSADCRTVLSGDGHNTLRLWDLSRVPAYLAFASSVPQAQATLREHPDDPAALMALGEWYAFRGKNDWAVELLEKARAGRGEVDPLTLARCYWELSDDLPPTGSLTRAASLAAAKREYASVLKTAKEPKNQAYLRLCSDAVERAIAAPASQPTAKSSNDRR